MHDIYLYRGGSRRQAAADSTAALLVLGLSLSGQKKEKNRRMSALALLRLWVLRGASSFGLPPLFGSRFLPVLEGFSTNVDDLVEEGSESSSNPFGESIWFAVPKRKVSHSRKRNRSAHKALPLLESTYSCPRCQTSNKMHHICRKCMWAGPRSTPRQDKRAIIKAE